MHPVAHAGRIGVPAFGPGRGGRFGVPERSPVQYLEFVLAVENGVVVASLGRFVADDVLSDPGVSVEERLDVLDLGQIGFLRPEDVELLALKQLAEQIPAGRPFVVLIGGVVVLDVVGGDTDRVEPCFARGRFGGRVIVSRAAQREKRQAEQEQTEKWFSYHFSERDWFRTIRRTVSGFVPWGSENLLFRIFYSIFAACRGTNRTVFRYIE